jgi:hypothetical protein
VESFEELTSSDKKVPIHKPILCAVHHSESLKFFCYTCQVISTLKHKLAQEKMHFRYLPLLVVRSRGS